jgi:hypothetical protein
MKANQVTHQSDGTTVLVLERRNGEKIACYFDTQDYDRVKAFRWSVKKCRHTSYVQTYVQSLLTNSDGKKAKTLQMHRVLLPEVKLIDHKDGNGLNNRRSNLRPATHLQNLANCRKIKRTTTSRYRGVSWHERAGKYFAQIRINGQKTSLGLFESEKDAALAYNAAALEQHGEFAKLNDVSAHVESVREPRIRGRHNSRKTRCPAGHPLVGDNLLSNSLKRGSRSCKTCHNYRCKIKLRFLRSKVFEPASKVFEPAIPSQPLPVSQIQLTLFS